MIPRDMYIPYLTGTVLVILATKDFCTKSIEGVFPRYACHTPRPPYTQKQRIFLSVWGKYDNYFQSSGT